MKKVSLISVWALSALFCYSTMANAATTEGLPKIIRVHTNCDNPNNQNQNISKLFDGNLNSKWYADKGFMGKFPCIIIWEYNANYSAKSYSLTSANDVPNRDPKSWKLYGSTNGKDYTLLDKQSNITFEERNDTRNFPLKETANYKYYKLEITKVGSGSVMPPQLSEIELESTVAGTSAPESDNIEIVNLEMVETPQAMNIKSDCDNPNNKNQKVTNLFDGNAGSKWFSDKGFAKSFPCFISWEYAKPLEVKSYSLTSGNDMPARDPKAWNLYGSKNGKDYVLIDKQENVVFEDRIETKDFNLQKPVNYKYFKFEILGVAAGNTNTPPQLSEIELK